LPKSEQFISKTTGSEIIGISGLILWYQKYKTKHAAFICFNDLEGNT
jgi:hypothetical protein